MPDAETAIKHAHDKNIPIFIVTNQGGIGRGFFTIQDMQNFHKNRGLTRLGGPNLAMKYCTFSSPWSDGVL